MNKKKKNAEKYNVISYDQIRFDFAKYQFKITGSFRLKNKYYDIVL